ncbi:hypothetical protein [Streptomyces sp. NBC_00239]|uniref:hypothetical protein n=1 Tax=Streptomyces sp. NBC_00239 TaxID=2903640 RepID=UPI002E2C9FC7|nr:hypothetical protein [Streptomyces sp. NBC_00239]
MTAREPIRPRFRDPFIAWLLERADAVGINNEAGRPYISVAGVKAVDEGLTDDAAEELSTLLDVAPQDVWMHYREAGYGA